LVILFSSKIFHLTCVQTQEEKKTKGDGGSKKNDDGSVRISEFFVCVFVRKTYDTVP